jgi:hypothetical protein
MIAGAALRIHGVATWEKEKHTLVRSVLNAETLCSAVIESFLIDPRLQRWSVRRFHRFPSAQYQWT